ncbi:MAG: alkylphosphonate utilization protein, partial [Pseudomonas fluorescens]|nr:alkylphosphonate utilization protein [Pseudomonas fluorescens]
MSTLPPCPKCNSEYTYEDGAQLICPECAHEWSASGEAEAVSDDAVKKDSVGNV